MQWSTETDVAAAVDMNDSESARRHPGILTSIHRGDSVQLVAVPTRRCRRRKANCRGQRNRHTPAALSRAPQVQPISKKQVSYYDNVIESHLKPVIRKRKLGNVPASLLPPRSRTRSRDSALSSSGTLPFRELLLSWRYLYSTTHGKLHKENGRE